MLNQFLKLLGVLIIIGPPSIQTKEFVSISLDIPEDTSKAYSPWNIPYPVSSEEMNCLALNVYFEARDQHPDGQFAVADVVMHRVNNYNYPNTICGVVKQASYYSWSKEIPIERECHFSWYCDRKPDIPLDDESFKSAVYVADTVLNDPKYIPEVEFALFYHADYVTPSWSKNMKLKKHIGNHLFY